MFFPLLFNLSLVWVYFTALLCCLLTCHFLLLLICHTPGTHLQTHAHLQTYVFTCTHTHTCTLTHGHTSEIHGWHPLPSCILMLHEPPPMYAITVAPSPLAHLTHGHTGCRGRGRGRVMRVGVRVRVGEYEYMSTFCGLACCCLHS